MSKYVRSGLNVLTLALSPLRPNGADLEDRLWPPFLIALAGLILFC